FHEYLLAELKEMTPIEFRMWLDQALGKQPDLRSPIFQLFGESIGTLSADGENAEKYKIWVNTLYKGKTELDSTLFALHKNMLVQVLSTKELITIYYEAIMFSDIWNKAPEDIRLKAAPFFDHIRTFLKKELMDTLETYATNPRRMQ